MTKSKKFRWGSVVTGILFGLLLGYWLSIILPKINIIVPGEFITLSVIGAVMFGFIGYFLQKTTEIIAYALSAFIIFQFTWDIGVEKIVGPLRIGLFWRAIILLLINSFSGHYGLNKALVILARNVGIK